MSQTVTVQPGFASAPLPVAPYSLVSVTPTSSASVVYTGDSMVAINNQTATWSAWPAGTVTALASQMANSNMFVRMSANTGAATITISNPNPQQFDADPIPWVGGGQTFSGPILAANGSVAAPSISFASDPDSGFFWSTAQGAFDLSLNGINRFRFNATGPALEMASSVSLRWSTGAVGQASDVMISRTGGGMQLTASTMGFYSANVTTKPGITGTSFASLSMSSGALASTLAIALNSLGLIQCTSVAG